MDTTANVILNKTVKYSQNKSLFITAFFIVKL